MDDGTRTAIEAFPVLRRLADLRDAGWQFFPVLEAGELVEVRGVRGYPEGFADALMVRDAGDAAALRGDHDGGVVWTSEGSVSEVVDSLISLPGPGSPHAPKLVRATMPQLWTPGRP